MCNTVPIYWGSSKIHEFFNKHRFINVGRAESADAESTESAESADADDWIRQIQSLLDNDEKYLHMLNQNVYTGTNNESIINIKTVANEIKSRLGAAI